MIADGDHVPKYARVADAVKGLIADGDLRPGQPAPSGAALSRITGYSTLTCRRALRLLIADGVLTPGASPNARPRVAGPPQQQTAERDLAAAARALSAGLASRRRAKGLTQPELAAIVDVSVTTVGHAETGRLWQSRQFWEHADAVLGAGGDLLKLHDDFGEASAVSAMELPGAPPDAAGPGQPGPGEPAPAASSGAPADGPEPRETGPAEDADTPPGAGQAAGQASAPSPETAPDTGDCPAAEPDRAAPASREPAGPACVMIMWSDGTTTTVRPPGAPGRRDAG